jgi:hypothetical protein
MNYATNTEIVAASSSGRHRDIKESDYYQTLHSPGIESNRRTHDFDSGFDGQRARTIVATSHAITLR